MRTIACMKRSQRPPTKRKRWLAVVLAVLVCWAGFTAWHAWFKPLPDGISFNGPVRAVAAEDVRFLADVTFPGANGPVIRQEIFDGALRLISNAEHLVVADLFLFNDYLGMSTTAHRPLSREIAAALIARKQARPDLSVVVVTDPVNNAYGGGEANPLRALRDAGIPVVITNLDRLRDSNPLWSGFWRLAVKPFGTSPGGWLPHPFAADAGRVGLRSWFALLNFKANHRKVIIADAPRRTGAGRELAALVMSANPHDGSSAHGNVAFAVRGAIAEDLLRAEAAVLNMSGHAHPPGLPEYPGSNAAEPSAATAHMRVLTEGAIRHALLDVLATTGAGDRIDLALFYLSDRRIIAALKSAAARGAHIRLLLDQNRDAFGYAKDGVPNKPVAAELTAAHPNIIVRWYDTRGEQFHAKAVLVHRAGRSFMLAGSANLTRRNLADLNLETNLALEARSDFPALLTAQAWFDGLWHNRTGPCTRPYADGADDSPFRRWKYRVQEATGLGTF